MSNDMIVTNFNLKEDLDEIRKMAFYRFCKHCDKETIFDPSDVEFKTFNFTLGAMYLVNGFCRECPDHIPSQNILGNTLNMHSIRNFSLF